MDNKKLVEITIHDVDCKFNLKKHNLVTTYNEKNELVITVIHNNVIIDIITIPNGNLYGKKIRHRL